jgi:ribosomal RNA-processing protein 12
MEDALAKIRVHTSSTLLHQKRPATLLVALESTLKEQNAEKSPTAYFAALLTTLESTLQREDVGLGEADVLPAELYLLALVMPFVPQPVIRSHLPTLISLTAPLFPALEAESFAGPLKSQLSIYDSIFHALDKQHLESQGTRQTFASILQLCVDRRPKVRRKASDVVKDILESPPPPLVTHPYAERVAQWVQDGLSSVGSKVFQKSKSSGTENPAVTLAIHIITFTRPVIALLSPSVSLHTQDPVYFH